MQLLLAIHKSLDYFFCDRCPNEAFEEGESFFADLIGDLCPIQYLWDYLPEELHEEDHPTYFPRWWLEKREEQKGIYQSYNRGPKLG